MKSTSEISWDKAAITAGGVAGVFHSVTSLILVIAAIETNLTGSWGYYNDPFILLDVLVIFVLAIGVLEKSRVASTCLVIYCGMNWYMYFQGVTPQGYLYFAFVISLIYFFACIATFVNFKKQILLDKEYKTGNKWLILSGIIVLAIILLLIMMFAIDYFL